MPTRGYGVFRRLLLGSVTAKVLHDADCPVWTGVHPETFTADGALSIGSIACAVDLGPQTRSAVTWAAGFAASRNARLTIIHVVSPVPDADWRERLRNMAHDQLTALRNELHTPAEVHVEFGQAPRDIPEIVKRLGADILVIGRGHTGSGGRLAGGAYAIVRDSVVPVVSV
jgi:nucleotide-binding universal stress UspA family protein